MNLYDKIKRGWAQSSDELTGSAGFWERSAMGMSLLENIQRVLTAENIHGKLLDAGAGKLPHRYLVKPFHVEYKSLDFKPTHPELDYVADVQAMPISDKTFDSAMCFEVLEHVPNPEKGLRELYRVLKPGGTLVFSVPHFLYLHNEPYDFYRYTKYGIRELATRVGFEVINIRPSGGLMCFLHGLGATAAVGVSYGIPIVWPIVFQLNKFTGRVAIWLDKHIDKRHLLPLHHVTVVRRPYES